MMQAARIEWAPKVRREQVWRLYQQDARGGADDALLEEVAFALYQRCESILMVTDNNRVPCPSCHTIIVAPGARWSRATPIICPECGWNATYGQLRDSWRHRDLHGGNAMYAFRAYVEGYTRHTSPRDRMLAVDRLINAFHWSIRQNRAFGPAARNLIEGSSEEVAAFLDRLTYGDVSMPPLPDPDQPWRASSEQVAARRRGVAERAARRPLPIGAAQRGTPYYLAVLSPVVRRVTACSSQGIILGMHAPDQPGLVLPLDSTILTQVVRAALVLPDAIVDHWQVRPAGPSQGAATVGVYWVAGTARVGPTVHPWAVILKLIRPAANAHNPAALDPAHPIYWKREALAYQSGVLVDLPGGVDAPHCFAVEERADETSWVWLEAVRDAVGPRWSLADYARAAACLGRFNGAYLAGRLLPDVGWLGPPGALRGMLEHLAFVEAVVRDPLTWQQPLLRAAFRQPVAESLLRLWNDRHRLLDAIERLPLTLCHKDAFRRNLFWTQAPTGAETLTLIDWAYVGHGEIGLDAADLFGASYHACDVATADVGAFDRAVFNSYLGGLRTAGWQGAAEVARLGYAATAALKYGWVLAMLLGRIGEPEQQALFETFSGQPMGSFVRQQARLLHYLLGLADEARELLARV